MAINCTLCGMPAEFSSTYTKKRKWEPDYSLPFGISQKPPKDERRLMRRNGGITDIVEGVCDRCSMLIAGYIESLRKPPV